MRVTSNINRNQLLDSLKWTEPDWTHWTGLELTTWTGLLGLNLLDWTTWTGLETET